MTTTNVYVNREFDCAPAELFNWLLDPSLVARWFGPRNLRTGQVKIDPRVGGEYSIELIPQEREPFFIVGRYQEVSEFDRLVFSFNYVGLSKTTPESMVIITLEAIGEGRTKLSLTQKFDVAPDDMPNRTAAWEHMLGELRSCLKT